MDDDAARSGLQRTARRLREGQAWESDDARKHGGEKMLTHGFHSGVIPPLGADGGIPPPSRVRCGNMFVVPTPR
jgi:hypothetical protein